MNSETYTLNAQINLLTDENDRLTEYINMLTSEKSVLVAKVNNLENEVLTYSKQRSNNVKSLYDFFQPLVQDCDDDDEEITVNIDELNSLFIAFGISPISRERKYEVQMTITVNATAWVLAQDEDNARDIAENLSFDLTCNDSIEDFDYNSYDFDIDVIDIIRP